MFSRKFISVLMTAIVLACPFVDGGECCGMCSPDSAAEIAEIQSSHGHGCDCSGDDDNTPILPGPGHDCPDGCHDSDCVCSGAVLAESTKCPNRDDVLVASAYTLVMFTSPSFAQDTAATFMCRGCHFPPLIVGRDIRTLVASYLL